MIGAYLLKPPVGAVLNRSHPHNSGLVAWWLMNEGGGVHILDSVSNRPGTFVNLTGTGWTDTILGRSLTLSGSNEYITVPDFPGVAFGTADFGIRLKVSTVSTGFELCIGKPDSGGSYWLGFNNGLVRFNLASVTVDSALSSYNDGNIHQIDAFRISGVAYLYVDGLLSASAAASNSIGVAGAVFGIGDFGSGGGFYWPGKIYDLQIYSRGFSSKEIEACFVYPYGTPNNPRFLVKPKSRIGIVTAGGGGGPTPTAGRRTLLGVGT